MVYGDVWGAKKKLYRNYNEMKVGLGYKPTKQSLYRQVPRKPRLVGGDEPAQSKNNKI
jgi:hypothetical protein